MVSAALLLFGALARPAQVKEIDLAPLRGLDQVQVLVEELDADAQRCGLTKDSLQLAASRTLVDGGIKVSPDASVIFYLNVNVAATPDGLCVAAVNTSARLFLNVTLPYATKPALVAVQVWDTGTLLSGSKFDAETRFVAPVRRLVDEFVTKVKLANQK